MRVHLLNPNTSSMMTEQMAIAARQVSLPDTDIIAVTTAHGPVSIESALDEAIASASLLDDIARMEQQKVDAHIIACFGDPGVDAAREIADAPVIGIADAAFRLATMISHRFAIVTTRIRAIAFAEQLLTRYGFAHQCSGIYASDLPVLSLEAPDQKTARQLCLDCQKAIDDGAEAIVLGCGGMAYLADKLQKQFQLPVIDGVRAAVKLAESLAQLGLRTAKRGQYGQPYPKPFKGRYQHWS